MKANFERLLCNYPSGMDVNSLLAAKYFGLHKQNIVVGNGAAELIKSLMSLLPGKTGMAFPTFEEYPNRRDAGDIIAYCPENADFLLYYGRSHEIFADRGDIDSRSGKSGQSLGKLYRKGGSPAPGRLG